MHAQCHALHTNGLTTFMLPVALSSACISVIYTELVKEEDMLEDEARTSEWLHGGGPQMLMIFISHVVGCGYQLVKCT